MLVLVSSLYCTFQIIQTRHYYIVISPKGSNLRTFNNPIEAMEFLTDEVERVNEMVTRLTESCEWIMGRV